MKKLFVTVLLVSIVLLLGSIGFGCGDTLAAHDTSDTPDKCEYILEVNSEVYSVDGVFYLPEIDAFVVRKPDLTEFVISRDTVLSFYIYKP